MGQCRKARHVGDVDVDQALIIGLNLVLHGTVRLGEKCGRHDLLAGLDLDGGRAQIVGIFELWIHIDQRNPLAVDGYL